MTSSTRIPLVTLGGDWPDQSPIAGSFDFTRWDDWTVTHSPTDLAGRYAFHEFVFIAVGQVWHIVDGETREIGPGTLSLIAPGQVFNCARTAGLTGWRLRFTDEFLPDAAMATQVFSGVGRSLVIPLEPDDLQALSGIADLIERECARPSGMDQAAALRHLLALLLVHTERMIRSVVEAGYVEREDQRAFRTFVSLLENHFAIHHDVRRYADMMGLSPVRLSTIVGRSLGMSTKRAIDERLVLETKRLLRYSSLSVGQIATRLGYTDQFHLSKTFKRLTGTSPLAYRHLKQ